MAQAHAKQRDPPRGSHLHRGDRDARRDGLAGPGRDHDARQPVVRQALAGARVARQRLQRVTVEGVVAHHPQRGAGHLERLHEVEGEAVVVVDDHDHAVTPARRTSSPRAFVAPVAAAATTARRGWPPPCARSPRTRSRGRRQRDPVALMDFVAAIGPRPEYAPSAISWRCSKAMSGHRRRHLVAFRSHWFCPENAAKGRS